MYEFILATHNILRWLVVIAGLIAVGRAFYGWLGKQSWTKTDRMLGMIFASMIDIQLLLGLFLLFSRPINTFGDMIRDHVIPMIVAVVVVHLGSVFARRAELDVMKHRRAALWFTIAFLVILVSIPWGRALLPGM